MRRSLPVICFLFVVNLIVFGQNNNWRQYANTKNVKVLEESENKIWIGTAEGLLEFDKQTGQVVHYNTLTGGLSNNNITSLAITNEGHIWIGAADLYSNQSGLTYFDGINWTHYTTTNSGLCGNDIYSLYIEENGILWIGTNNGLSKRLANGTWISYTHGGVPYDNITCMDMDNSGNLWMGTESDGITRFDGNNWNSWSEYTSDLPGDEITDIEACENGHIWIATDFNGLAEFDGSQFITYNYENSGLGCSGICSLDFDSNGILWIGTDCGVYSYDGVNWVEFPNWNSSLPHGSAKAVIAGSDNKIWAGMALTYCEDGGGLASFDGTDWTAYSISQIPMYCNHINALAFTDTTVIWAGSYNSLMKFDGYNWINYTEDNSLLPGQVASMTADDTGRLWIGTTGGLARFDGTYWQIFTESTSGLINNQISDITFDLNGVLWIGTYYGLSRYDGTDWTSYDETNSGLPNDRITAISSDKENNIWISSQSGKRGDRSLTKYNGSEWVTWDRDNSSFPAAEVKDIVTDELGNVWLASPQGLIQFDGIEFITHVDTNNQWNDFMTSIEIDANGHLWLGEYGYGLIEYDGTNWTYYNEDNSPIFGSVVNDVIITPDGTKWIGSWEGLSAYNENGLYVSSSKINITTDKLNVYPNPATEQISISLPYGKNITKLQVINLTGKVVRSTDTGRTLDIRSLAPGIYWIQAFYDDIMQTAKFIKL